MLRYPRCPGHADARIATFYGGTTEIMKEIIGRSPGAVRHRLVVAPSGTAPVSGWQARSPRTPSRSCGPSEPGA